VTELLPGTQVKARGLRWEVVFSQPAGEHRLYRLRSLERGLGIDELDVLSFEKIEPLATDLDPRRAARLVEWRVYHDAFLLEQALGPNVLLAAQPGRLRIAAYQIVPVLRALQMPRPRLLLADDVGLGKTIEAGLLLAELIARRRAHRILIVAPAGPLLMQWREEMRERFGLRFRMLDSDALKEIRRGSELGANPFDHVALGLISMDFAKQETVLQEIDRSHFDVVVLDEAHHCASLGGAGDLEDSRRRRLAEVLARKADALFLLTATPHDGYDPHFASLIELLDPSLVDGRGALRGEAYRNHVVRRLKRHIVDPSTREPMFRERAVHPIAVRMGTAGPVAAFYRGLAELVVPALRRAMRTRSYADVLAFMALLKRSVSTIHACKTTLAVIADRLRELGERGSEAQEARVQRLKTLRDLRRRLQRYGSLSQEETQDREALEAEDIASQLALLEDDIDDTQRGRRREQGRLSALERREKELRKLIALAAAAEPEDPKIAEIVARIRDIRRQTPRANVIVYTEYTDSLEVMTEALRGTCTRGELTGQILTISGADPDDRRSERTARFRGEDDAILVSTDASAEGLNLHDRCHHLIHLELPYNPNRIEQRNGRIDRFGQRHDPQIFYLFLAGTFEEHLLMRLVGKYEAQRQALGCVPNTLGFTVDSDDRLDRSILSSFASDEPSPLFAAQADGQVHAAEHDDLPAYKEILTQFDSVFADFERTSKTHVWLGHQGMNADEAIIAEADRAIRRGAEYGVRDLVTFVNSAVLADSTDPDAVHEAGPGQWTLQLPPAWSFGLDAQIPGWDPGARTLRLTEDMNQTHDAEGRKLGFLGRAHPIVARALDRVRNIRFGSNQIELDRRVGAAAWDGSEPALLRTYLGRVQSGAGREFERVLAVVHLRDGTKQPMLEPNEWLSWAEPKRGAASASAWEAHFSTWARANDPEPCHVAILAFSEGPAAEFFTTHESTIAAERDELTRWLRTRTEALCGARTKQEALFGPRDSVLPAWQTLADEAERLAAYATDPTVPPRSRSEAQGVLDLFRRRRDELDRRAALAPPEAVPLGLLMLLPQSGGARA
jgi:ERCC4-related helicase